MKLVFRISRRHKILRPSRVQLPLGWNAYLLFDCTIVNYIRKTNDEETESFVLFLLFWRWFNRRWVRGGKVGPKVLFSANWNRIFFFDGIKAEAISMTHSNKLYQLDISTFYFYDHCSFRFWSLRNLLKIWPFIVCYQF